MDVKEVLRKKVLGIPVIYLGVVLAAIIAFVAWRMKPVVVEPVTADTGTEGAVGSGDGGGVETGDLAGSVYDSLKTQGTVVVAPNPDTVDTPVVVKSNATWITDGVVWLQANDKATGTVATSALTKYVEGANRSYDEEALINLWIKQGGPPPDGVTPAGTIGSKPAQKQGSPPLVHTVMGISDNTYSELAVLYYGHTDQASFDLIQAANSALGLDGPFAVGSKISVPAYHIPKYYILPSAMSVAQICAKNGISSYQFVAMNNSTKQQWAKGSKVRVA